MVSGAQLVDHYLGAKNQGQVSGNVKMSKCLDSSPVMFQGDVVGNPLLPVMKGNGFWRFYKGGQFIPGERKGSLKPRAPCGGITTWISH